MARSDPHKKRFVLICPVCGRRCPVGTLQCPDDGARLESRIEIVCPTCGRANPPDARFCLEDGRPLFTEPSDVDEAPAPPPLRTEPPSCPCDPHAEPDAGEEPPRRGC